MDQPLRDYRCEKGIRSFRLRRKANDGCLIQKATAETDKRWGEYGYHKDIRSHQMRAQNVVQKNRFKQLKTRVPSKEKQRINDKPLRRKLSKPNHKATIYEERGTPVIDLHGLTRMKEAMESCHRFLRAHWGQTFEIIVGKGNHSPNGRPVLKPAVKKMLKARNIHHGEVETNSGRLFAVLRKRY